MAADDLIAAAEAEIAAARLHCAMDPAEKATHAAEVWERVAGQLQQQRDEARADLAMLWDATGIDREISDAAFVADAIRGMVDTTRMVRTQLRPQLARAEAERDAARRELAEVTRQRDDDREFHRELLNGGDLARLRENLKVVIGGLDVEIAEIQDQGLPCLARTEAHRAILRALLHQTATETGPSATESHEKADTGVTDGGDTPQAHRAAQAVDRWRTTLGNGSRAETNNEAVAELWHIEDGYRVEKLSSVWLDWEPGMGSPA